MESKSVSSNSVSAFRKFVEKCGSLRLPSAVLKRIVFSLIFFLNTQPLSPMTAAKATSHSLTPSHEKRKSSLKVNSKSSPKIRSSFKLAFFERHAEGWHWYEEQRVPKIEERKENSESPSGRSSPFSSSTPMEKIEAQRKELETKLHTAILEPNRDNIITYILAQKALMDQSCAKSVDGSKRTVFGSMERGCAENTFSG